MDAVATGAGPSAQAPWTVAVHLTHPDVPAWVFAERHAARLAQAVPGVICRICPDRACFRAALPDAHAALVWSFRQEEFSLAPRLRLVATPAAGRDYFRVEPPPGVSILYGRFHGRIMAETALGMLLGMTRGLLPAVSTYAGDPWPRRRLAAEMRPLRGAHVVILGFGRIGQSVGRLLKAFPARVTGVRRSDPPGELPEGFAPGDRVVSAARLDDVLPEADHLVMTLPADPSTDGLMDARRLALLPPHATVTNLGRGNALDEEALAAALRQGRLAGACLDVFRVEPLTADSPLRGCPRLWTFPHASAISPDYMDLFVGDLACQIRERFGTGA